MTAVTRDFGAFPPIHTNRTDGGDANHGQNSDGSNYGRNCTIDSWHGSESMPQPRFAAVSRGETQMQRQLLPMMVTEVRPGSVGLSIRIGGLQLGQ